MPTSGIVVRQVARQARTRGGGQGVREELREVPDLAARRGQGGTGGRRQQQREAPPA